MSLAAGTRLGAYEILAAIGAGGMGEVYRARDRKLQREVAIKVLPELLAGDPDRLKRFEREAQTLAALNHSHIAQIHGFEESNGVHALVMELVDGPTLADRIAQGPIAVDEALAIAKQIADALEAAHEHGIVHRDLKPANIKVRGDGTVKVLDFGLAKALSGVAQGFSPADGRSPEGPRHNSPESALTSPALTVAGVILGTAAYMAPEQARGKAVDKRADIWAFGVVLFEMLAGRRPFADGDDVVSTVASVVKDQPAFAALPAGTPVSVRRLLRRCLDKDPRQRLADIADARFDLTEAIDAKPDGDARPIAHRAGRERMWQAVAALAAVAVIVSWAWPRAARSSGAPAASLSRIDVDLGPELSLESIGPSAVLSPDGTRVVFVAKRADENARLLTRRLEEPTATELQGTEGAHAPFFSPDGQWIGFFAAGKLKKVPIDGSRVINLCDASAGRGASWSDDGAFIVAALDNQSALMRVPAEGGSPRPLTKLEQGERTHRWPHVVAGLNRVVFIVNGSPGNFADSRIAAAPLDGAAAAQHRVLVNQPGMYPRYAANGHLTFVSKGTLYAVPLDEARFTADGAPIAVLESVANYEDFGSSQVDVSHSGSLFYHRGETVGLRTIAWRDRDGALETVVGDAAMYIYPKVSPDGRQIAFALASGSATDIWVYDWRTRTKARLTQGPGQKAYPVWSADSRYLVFGAPGAIFWIPADGAADGAKPLMKTDGSAAPYSFSPDGTLAYVEGSPDKGWVLKTVPVTQGPQGLSAGVPAIFVPLQSGAATSAFSPDGRWLAYTSNESGAFEVYVRDFPDKRTKLPVSSGGGMMPMWSRNGRELFYRSEDQRLMVVSYTARDGSFVSEPPRLWSTDRIANVGMSGNVDLAPDGRFVVLMPADRAESLQTRGHFTLVLNFFEEIKQRVAATKYSLPRTRK